MRRCRGKKGKLGLIVLLLGLIVILALLLPPGFWLLLLGIGLVAAGILLLKK